MKLSVIIKNIILSMTLITFQHINAKTYVKFVNDDLSGKSFSVRFAQFHSRNMNDWSDPIIPKSFITYPLKVGGLFSNNDISRVRVRVYFKDGNTSEYYINLYNIPDGFLGDKDIKIKKNKTRTVGIGWNNNAQKPTLHFRRKRGDKWVTLWNEFKRENTDLK